MNSSEEKSQRNLMCAWQLDYLQDVAQSSVLAGGGFWIFDLIGHVFSSALEFHPRHHYRSSHFIKKNLQMAGVYSTLQTSSLFEYSDSRGHPFYLMSIWRDRISSFQLLCWCFLCINSWILLGRFKYHTQTEVHAPQFENHYATVLQLHLLNCWHCLLYG